MKTLNLKITKWQPLALLGHDFSTIHHISAQCNHYRTYDLISILETKYLRKYPHNGNCKINWWQMEFHVFWLKETLRIRRKCENPYRQLGNNHSDSTPSRPSKFIRHYSTVLSSRPQSTIKKLEPIQAASHRMYAATKIDGKLGTSLPSASASGIARFWHNWPCRVVVN